MTINLDDIEWWRDLLARANPANTIDVQIMHIGAEYGELLEEWQIHNGYNLRKPRRNRGPEVRAEVADVAITAMVTLAMLADDWRGLLEDRLTTVTNRMTLVLEQAPS